LADAFGQALDYYPATGPTGVAAFRSGGEAGLVWIGGSGELLSFPGWREQPVPDWNGTPVALALTRRALKAVVRQQDGLWLVESSLADGSILSQRALPSREAPVLLNSDGSMLHSADGAVILSLANGFEQRIDIPARPETMEAMGPGWAAIRAAGVVYALNLSTCQLHRLPAPQPSSASRPSRGGAQ
jgi:hypothetical protein